MLELHVKVKINNHTPVLTLTLGFSQFVTSLWTCQSTEAA